MTHINLIVFLSFSKNIDCLKIGRKLENEAIGDGISLLATG